MLILTRKVDQSIEIGPDVTIMVLGVERDRVKLGIKAPRTTGVFRTELLERAYAEALAMEQAETQPTPIRKEG